MPCCLGFGIRQWFGWFAKTGRRIKEQRIYLIRGVQMSTFFEQLSQEIDSRIEEMGSPDYQYPKRIRKADWIGLFLIVLASAAIIISLVVYTGML